MTNNSFLKLVRSVLLQGFATQGITGVRVQQGFQKRTTSAAVGPVIVIHRIDDEAVGWESRRVKRRFDGTLSTTNEQNFVSTFQFNALAPRPDPQEETVDDRSSDDYLRLALMFLQGQLMIDSCKKVGLTVFKATVVSPNWVKDEHDNWENEPSFNLQIASKEVLEWATPAITDYDEHIYSV